MNKQTMHRALAALGVAGAMALSAGMATAQQAKQAPATTGATAAAAPAGQTAWVKLCEKVNAVKKEKDGKEVKEQKNLCLTTHERLDGASGMVLVSAAVRQLEGVDRQHLMVMVPLGMALPPNMRAAIYPKELWAKAAKNEKVDEKQLRPIELKYNLCHPAGCTAETELPKDALDMMKSGGGLMVIAINAGGQPIAFPVPLDGFGTTVDGKPVDGKEYEKARMELMKQIQTQQEKMMEDYQKQQAGQAQAPAKK